MQQRVDPYSSFHRGLRKALFEASINLGRVDYREEREVADLAKDMRVLLKTLRLHAEHEDTHLHPLLTSERRAQDITRLHDEHETDIRGIETLLQELEAGPAAERADIAAELYRTWNVFVSAQLLHLNFEETALLKEMWETVPEEHLAKAHRDIIASSSPEESQQALTWVCEAESVPTVESLLMRLRQQLPAVAFTAVLRGLATTSTRGLAIATRLGLLS